MPRASPSGNLVGSIRKAIAQRLAQGHPGIRDVAAIFGLNVRTLQRRLARIGVTYSGLVEEIRLETAARLLEEGGLTSAKIASALGYSDPAHFSRAFARWTGMAPRTYRRRLRQGSSDLPDLQRGSSAR